jgi:large subunit ribosomal protein L15
MKLHDLKPAPGSHKKKTRVGRGIAAGKGKTAGRGTKGQKARAGGKIPAWFEGGQTPLHQRIPKLRGFKNPFRIEYEVVNVGAIASLVELGVLEGGEMPGSKKAKGAAPAPITVNQEILRAAGLVRSLDKPMKILGNGELSTALFVVADRISASARAKIEAAGGTVSLLEVPTRSVPAIGVADAELGADADPEADVVAEAEPEPEPVAAAEPRPDAGAAAEPNAEAAPRRKPKTARAARVTEPEAEAGSDEAPPAKPAPRPKAKAKAAKAKAAPAEETAPVEETASAEPTAPAADDAADESAGA